MPRDGCAGRAQAARRWPSTTPAWWRRWKGWSIRRRAATRRGPLRWTCSSAARLSRELQEAGHRVSERSVNRLLHALGYSLQANRKTLEGKQHPDRDAQFNHINRRVRAFQRRRQPVVSVDTKKKELVGPFENAGREWRPRGHPEPVRVHDFPDKALGKAIPYGVYDLIPRRRLGERRRRSRHGIVRSGDVAAVVAADGLRLVSGRGPVVDHG